MRGIATGAFIVLLSSSLAACGGCGDDENINPDSEQVEPPDGPPIDGVDEPVPTAARGEYLVKSVALCNECHTPRLKDGTFDEANYLAGVECFIDIDPETADFGCLHTRNLTDHETGLANRSDAEIKAMFQDGVRPGGEALITVMPYWIFHNLTDLDADSIVLHLRETTGVDHAVPANEAPWTAPLAPADPFDAGLMPDDPGNEAGQYLAMIACLECHTSHTNPLDGSTLDTTKLFAGGRDFGGIFSANITPDATGIPDHTAAQIVTELLEGTDPNGDFICPPMPAGMFGGFGDLTPEDAAAIADYIDSLTAIENDFGPDACAIPAGP
jgi:mono/diheme cytochrome c family protein